MSWLNSITLCIYNFNFPIFFFLGYVYQILPLYANRTQFSFLQLDQTSISKSLQVHKRKFCMCDRNRNYRFSIFFLEKKNKNAHAKNPYPGSLLFLFLPILMLDLDAVPHRPLCFDAWSWAAGAVLEARGLLEEWMTSCLLSASCLPVQWDWPAFCSLPSVVGC